MPDEEEIPISIKVVNVRSLLRYVDEHGVEHMPDESDFIDWDDDMDTPPTIPPALTPEEWQHARELATEIDTLRFQLDCVQPDDFGAMAIANSRLPDTDPRKITREMVEGIRRLASRIDMSDGQCHFCGYRNSEPTTHDDPVHECPIFLADTWADALAALLPPDGN